MKGFSPTARWQGLAGGIARYGCYAAIALCVSGAYDCFAAESSAEYLDVTVEEISYQGNSRYKVDIAVHNRSDNAVVLKGRSGTFHVQTEVLGQWATLSASSATTPGSARLSPGQNLRVTYTVSIPLTIPGLYRNGAGDINMMFKHLVRFVPDSETGLRVSAGESSYWITPGTNTWVLREGM